MSGYTVIRYNVANAPQVVGGTCAGLVAATTCTETGVPTGTWTYSITPRIATNWIGAESARSSSLAVDAIPPTNAITLSGVTGGALMTGTTVYYRGVASGSFTLTNAVADAGSGPASSATAALTGTTTGWAHTPSTVTTPSGGPYVSHPFSWGAGTTSSPVELVTGADVGGSTAGTSLTFVNDSTPPTAGTISYLDGYQPARSVPVTFAAGTDAASGVATRKLQRSHATLVGGSCGTFSDPYDIGGSNPVSPYTDTAVYTGWCYKYRYVVTDAVGNQAIATSASVSKVDYGGAVGTTSGLVSWWRFGEAPITSTDRFNGTVGMDLSSQTADDGTTWTRRSGDTTTVVISNNHDVRQSAAGTSTYYTDEVPASADYLVEADIIAHTVRTGDQAGVVGRLDTANANGTFYWARYNRATTSWELYRRVNGVETTIGTAYAQTLTAGTTYRLGLQMTGTKLNLLVDGIVRATATDANITAAGRGGIRLISTSSTAPSTTVGQAVDNFAMSPPAADSKGTNTGDYHEGVALGVSGITADNTAATFTSAYAETMQTETTTAIPVGAAARSVEVWFKTTGAGAGMARQVLFDYGTLSNGQMFGAFLDPNGTTISAWGHYADVTYTWAQSFQDNQWHQFVMTYDGTSVRMYLDGVPSGALVPPTYAWNTVIDPRQFGVGGVLDPGAYYYPTSWFNGSLDEMSFYANVMDQQTVLNHYGLGTSPPSDTSGPTGGSVDATGLTGTGARYAPSTTLSIALNAGSDPSGMATSGARLLRATAPLTSTAGADGTCGAYGAYAAVGASDPTSPVADVVADQACYRYQYVVADIYGNATTYTSGDIKVDSTPPAAPALAFSGFTNTYWSGVGSSVFYRSAATSGSFAATASATDAASGIASFAFPALGDNWTSTPGALGVNTYSWSGAPAVPGTKTVTATNNAGGTSGATGFTLVADDTAPTAGTVSYLDGTMTGMTVSVSFTTGTDGGSGLGTRLLQRAAAPLTGGTCGAYGAFATVTGGTNPTSPVVDTVTAGTCNKYQYVVSDNVGNATTATSASEIVALGVYSSTVNATAGLLNYWQLGEASGTVMTDNKGAANGAYVSTPTLGVAGAITGDSNTAVTFNGTSQYATAPCQITNDFSIEFWFKSTQGIGTGAQWWEGAGLVDGDVGGSYSDFGTSLRSDGHVVAGMGPNPDTSIVSSAAGYRDGNWHHVVFTRVRATGAMVLYVDGVSQGTATASGTATVTTPTIYFGRIASGGNFFAGSLDEVATYNVALSPATVAAHYAAR